MSQPSQDANQTIQPVPIVRIEATAPAAQNPAEAEGDPTAHAVEHHGFACGAAELASTPGVPWDRRPLSRRGILTWTLAAMSGLVALVTTVAVARSRHLSSAADATATALHGAEATNAPPVPNLPPIAAPETHSPPIIPLEALPIDKAPTARHVLNTTKRGHGRTASSSIAVKKAAPSQRMLRQKTKRTP